MTRKLVEHIHTISTRVRGRDGTQYEARILGERRDDGTWAGWIEFHAQNDSGAVLATGGDLIFWGDLDQKFRAFDAESGKIVWETTLGGTIQNSTITYAVNGKQYVAVLTGEGLLTGGLITQAQLQPPRRYNALYVFALP